MSEATAAVEPGTAGTAVRAEGRVRWTTKFRGMPKVSAAFLLLVILAAIFANVIAPDDPVRVNLAYAHTPPVWAEGGTWARVLGADNLGRDVLSRLIHGARISLTVGLFAVVITATIGMAIGIASGYLGGKFDMLVSALVDMWLSIPGILFLLLLAMIIGRSITGIIIAISLLAWPRYARIVRGQVLALRNRDFVSLARVAGTRPVRIMISHIMPNIFSTVLVLATLDVGRVIVLESSLSYLGLGVPPPTPAWGMMVAEGQGQLHRAVWIALAPGVALAATVLSANSLGDWLRDVLDPKQAALRASRRKKKRRGLDREPNPITERGDGREVSA